MASVINTNLASLYAQKNLSGAQNALSTSVERLSSGLRINRAKDDAAGLGISEKIKSQVTSLNQGLRNANDAISMVQTAEGSLSEVSSILQRMKELSVQARNDSLSTTQRSFISDELVALKNEINSIAERTTFNDLSLLKNALRTDVVAPAAVDVTKVAKGATVISGVTVSDVKVANANAGTYSLTIGTHEAIDNQVSRVSTKLEATAGSDTTQSAKFSTVTAAANYTATLSGVYEAGDQVTFYVKDNIAGSVGTLTYTVVAEDLTLNGDGSGGAVAGSSSTAYSNIATKISQQSITGLSGASVANITLTSSGATFTVTDGRSSPTAGGSISIVADTSASAAATTLNFASNRAAGARTVTVSASDAAEGNKVTLTVNGKDYSVVVGSDMGAATIATNLKTAVLADYPSSATVASNVLTFATGSGLTGADMSIKVEKLVAGNAVGSMESYVSDVNASASSATRTIIINDFDIVAGRRLTVTTGNPEVTTSYSLVIDSDDTATTVAGKLQDLLEVNHGQATVATTTITFGSTAAMGTTSISLSFEDMVVGETVRAESVISSKTRAESARTITINQADLTEGNVVSVKIGNKEYATKVVSGDTDDAVAYRLASLLDDDYPNTSAAEATLDVPAATRISRSANVITLTADAKLGLADISLTVKSIADAGVVTLTAGDNTGIGGTSESVTIGDIASGASKVLTFDNLGVEIRLQNSGATTVGNDTFGTWTTNLTTLDVASSMDGDALFQIGAGTRDTVNINGFKDIRVTGHNQNSGDEKLVFDNINTTLNTIAANTTESLSEANFATLENQIEAAITTISDFRSYLGAQQNRIEFAISNIQAQSENLTAANSRIVDTDYAAETANLTKTQIMQQAATAMLAQANQMPNVILALLK
jgi:flagellin